MGKKYLLAFALLLALAQLASADQLADELSNFGSGLRAQYSYENTNLTESPQVILVRITTTNPFNTAMPVYILRQGEGGWEVVKLLGALPENRTTEIELEVEVSYEKETKRKTRYAIVGRGADGELYGGFFYIDEDWEAYEKNIDEGLSMALLYFVPAVTVLLVVLVVFLAYTAYSSKSKGITTGEYTLKTLVFPRVVGRPFEEKLADIMINPIMIGAELICVAVLVFLMFDNVVQASGIANAAKIMTLAAASSISIPLIYFAGCWYFERCEEGKPLRFFAGMFAWGMFAAFLSLLISSTVAAGLRDVVLLSSAFLATLFISPIVEEIVKGMGVLFMSGHHEYNDTLTGLLLGFTCGAGFALVENWFYFSSKATPFELGGLAGWGTLIIYRSLFNTLAHGCFTASVSTVIGYVRGMPKLRRFARLAFIPGIFVAISIHAIFNLSALADGFVVANRQTLFFIFNPMLIILLVAMFFLVLVLAVIDEKKRKIKNAAAASDGGAAAQQ